MDVYKRIAKDSKQALIQLVSEAGNGKTSSIRTIINRLRQQNPEIVFKIFDVSQAWFHCAPTRHRQLVTTRKLMKGQVANIDDCVYEMGDLSEDGQRAFVGTILSQDWDLRYRAKLDGELDKLPFIVYVFEEANIYFGSYSFRKNDEYKNIFAKYVSVGRNYKMRGFLISTAEQGEIAPSLRRRSRKIYGKLVNKSDLSEAKRIAPNVDFVNIPKYNFHYYGKTFRIPDEVNHVPEDYIHEPETVEKNDALWVFLKYMGLTVFLLYMLFSYFAG